MLYTHIYVHIYMETGGEKEFRDRELLGTPRKTVPTAKDDS